MEVWGADSTGYALYVDNNNCTHRERAADFLIGCYPFQDNDPFVIEECPHVYFVGNQPRYDTTVIEGPAGQAVRLICVPQFKETGEVVVLDTDTLEPEIVRFSVYEGKP